MECKLITGGEYHHNFNYDSKMFSTTSPSNQSTNPSSLTLSHKCARTTHARVNRQSSCTLIKQTSSQRRVLHCSLEEQFGKRCHTGSTTTSLLPTTQVSNPAIIHRFEKKNKKKKRKRRRRRRGKKGERKRKEKAVINDFRARTSK